MVTQAQILECLKELGGRATVRQLKKLIKQKDPLGDPGGVAPALNGAKRWKEVDYDKETNEWYLLLSST